MTVMQNHTLQSISQENDLGVFNSRLSFDACINDKFDKASKTLGLISRNITIRYDVTLVQLHRAFDRPYLELSNCTVSIIKEHSEII